MNLSKQETKFLNLIMTSPQDVFRTLDYLDLIKPFVYIDLTVNKFGYRSISKKYQITESAARTLIKKIKKNIEKWYE